MGDATLTGSTAIPDEAAAKIHSRRWFTLAVLCLSLVLIVAGNASLNVALPDISERLGSGPAALQWIVNIYGLIFAGLLLPAGALADRFGRKTALQGGLFVFAAAAFAASYGTETWHLIAARGVMGVGAAFIMPGTLSVLSNVFTETQERRKAISIWAGFAGLGGALGSVLSGLLLINSTWTTVFRINAPIAAVALVAGLWLVPNSSDPKDAKLDPPGVVLAIAGLGTLLYAIIEAPNFGWMATRTSVLLVLAAILLGVFAWWELHTDQPMLDIRLFRNRSFALGSSTIMLQYLAMFGLFFALSQYLQLGHGFSALETALLSLPIGIFALIGAPLSAANVNRFGARNVVGSGLLVSGAGLVLLGITSTSTVSIGWLILGFSMVGLGNGQTTAPSTTLIMNSVPRAKSGVGSAVNDVSRELGGALGVAVFGSILASSYRSSITDKLGALPDSIRQEAQNNIVTTLEAASRLGNTGNQGAADMITRQATEVFSAAFGRTMIYASVVIFLNAAIVWVLQVRHGSRPGANPAATPGRTDHRGDT